jgi:hypothetical protein
MARTVVVICDVHQERGQRVECEELPPITIEGKSPRVIALCPQCKDEYYDPFKQLVDDLGLEVSDGDDQQPTRTDDSPAEKAEKAGEADAPSGEESDEVESSTDDQEEKDDEEPSTEDPDRIVAESPAMDVVRGEPDTARWTCPVDDCGKTYEASGEQRADDLKRLGNLHLSTSHHLDKAARLDLLSA